MTTITTNVSYGVLRYKVVWYKTAGKGSTLYQMYRPHDVFHHKHHADLYGNILIKNFFINKWLYIKWCERRWKNEPDRIEGIILQPSQTWKAVLRSRTDRYQCCRVKPVQKRKVRSISSFIWKIRSLSSKQLSNLLTQHIYIIKLQS